MSFVDRVAEQALKIKATRVLLWLLAAPFYLVGLVVGLVFVSGSFILAAVKLGVADARVRIDRNGGRRAAD